MNDAHSTQWAVAAGSLLGLPRDSVEPVEQGASTVPEGLSFIPCEIIQSSVGRLVWLECDIEPVLSKIMRLKALPSPTPQTHTSCKYPGSSGKDSMCSALGHGHQVITGCPGTLNRRAACVSSSVFVFTTVPSQFSSSASSGAPVLVLGGVW